MRVKKIIFIVGDTTRSQNIGLYNKAIKTTPNIDQLGKNGTVFLNAFTTFTNTDPAITSMMTGKYPISLGLVNHASHVTREEELNLKSSKPIAEILQEQGFYTAAVDWLGRWHKRGFDYYSGQINKPNPQITVADKFPFPLPLRLIDKLTVKFLKREIFIRFYYAFFSNPLKHYDDAKIVVDKGIEILEKKRTKNLFLYLHFWDAHSPHTLPKGLKSYLTDTVEDTYQAEINYLDTELGRLTTYLKKTDQLKETLIIFTGDHGENLYGHDIPFNHENLYEDVVKVPLLFSHPELKLKSVKKIVQHPDILPTVLKLLKLKQTGDIDGIDLYSPKQRGYAYFEDISYRKMDFPKQTRRRGIRTDKYKYIQSLVGAKADLRQITPREDLQIIKEELFDLKKDPLEKVSISNPNLKEHLRIKLLNETYTLLLKRFSGDSLYPKYKKVVNVISQSVKKYHNQDIALAWKGGKDTTTLMHILRMHFQGKIPFKVFFNDTTMEFKAVYTFINQIKKIWKLDLYIIPHTKSELDEFKTTKDEERKKELAKIMKITAIKKGLKQLKVKAYMLGIRRDENQAREKEKYFSPRGDHIRIHPLLDFTEKDVWRYIHFFGVPYLPLYDQGYRSVGEQPFTKKTSQNSDERAGRDQDKEKTMARLRKLGYW